MPLPLLLLAIQGEQDVVVARQRARQIAELLGFGVQDQTRIATAASEIARNAFRYAEGGRVEFEVAGEVPRQELIVRFSDQGPGIADLDAVLDGGYASATGMGLAGARRIVDSFHIESRPGEGTTVVLGKALPPGVAVHPARLRELGAALAQASPRDPLAEVQQQNRELLRTLGELRARQQELTQLNRELDDTNRGVVALYAELDERLEQLRRANALRAQFTSYLSHEFRTPLDSMIALSGLLLARVDGELEEEQEKQVMLLRRSAQDLLNLVDDLLDTARVEAGQVAIRPVEFSVEGLFSALRATLRPLSTNPEVALVFDSAPEVPLLHTDEAKLSQILRNFISNALKFTERGEIRVQSRVEEGDRVCFLVRDTGVGIAPVDQEWIFEDFAQVEGLVQRRVKGTGLGLALSRKLARLLGGEVGVQSAIGQGSTFFVTVPREYDGAAAQA